MREGTIREGTIMREELERDEVHRVADQLIEEVLHEYGIHEPAVDVLALARHLGVEVNFEKTRRGQRLDFAPLDLPEERRQAIAAQALGEHLKPELLQRLGLEPGGLLGESFTNLLAARLLVPTEWLADAARSCGYDILELHGCFHTAGAELIAFRLLDLESPCTITFVENGHVSKRRSNAYRVSRELLPPERACLNQIQRYSRPCCVSEDGWDVRGWPLHREDWKCEILRSVHEE